jgi:hypothetical protein
MMKKQDKSQKVIPLAPEEVKYYKKSDAKGHPRSNHKHLYETVCLHHKYSLTKPHDTNPWNVDYHSATKVCTICGRIEEADESYYKKESGHNNWGTYFSTKLIPEAFDLPRWIVEDARCKNARKEVQ